MVFVQHGVRLALFWLLMWAVWAPAVLLVEDGVIVPLLAVLGVGAALSGLAVWLPTRAVHRTIRAAKQSELGRVRDAIEGAREEALGAGASAAVPAAVRLPGLIAYEQRIADVSEWLLDARLCRTVALEQRLEADLGPLLRRVAREHLYRLRGYAGLERYAAERLGMSPRKAWALLRVGRAAERCPALRAAYRDGALSWVQALVPIVARTPTHAEGWIACARRIAVRRLRDDVDRALLLADRDPAAFARDGGLPHLDAELAFSTDAEAARLQTGANPRDPEATHLSGDSAPRETARAFFTAPRGACATRSSSGSASATTGSSSATAGAGRCPAAPRTVIRVVGRARTRFAIGARRGRPPLAVYAKGDALLAG